MKNVHWTCTEKRHGFESQVYCFSFITLAEITGIYIVAPSLYMEKDAHNGATDSFL